MSADLVVVVADGGIEQAIRGILDRPAALGIRPLIGLEFPKFKPLDGGAFAKGHEIAALYRDTHTHALVVFDLAFDRPAGTSAQKLEADLDARLSEVWGPRARCIVIEPELEAWVWSDSPHVATELGWDSLANLRRFLEGHGLWTPGTAKPADPKEAYLRAIRAKRIQQSNATFRQLAGRVSVSRCQDRAFNRLVQTLREWFPAA